MEEVDAMGNMPQARFGQPTVFIGKGKAILFGGATGDNGRFSITGETFSFDVNTKSWKKVESKAKKEKQDDQKNPYNSIQVWGLTTGNYPSPRAGHASVAVELNQVMVYGGVTEGDSLASDDLYFLDMRGSDDTGIWTVVPVVGQTPGRRYGHSITYSKPYLVVFGGNTGQEPVNDCWFLNIEKSPFNWVKVDLGKQEQPRVRVYLSAFLYSSGRSIGMVMIYGGRSNDQSTLNDTWGLRRHRDGRWDWVKVSSKADKDQPTERYYHSSYFVEKPMLIVGGRTNNVGEQLSLEVYDTETSEWAKFNSLQRFRHGSWIFENFVYVYEDFELESPNTPTDNINKVNILKCFQSNNDLIARVLGCLPATSPTSALLFDNSFSNLPNSSISTPDMNSTMNSNVYGNQSRSGNNSQNNSFTSSQSPYSPMGNNQNLILSASNQKTKNNNGFSNYTIGPNNVNGNRLVGQNKLNTTSPGQVPRQQVQKQFEFLDPLEAEEIKENAAFKFTSDHIIQLCDQAEEIIKNQPMVLRVRAPLKIFGGIHGQYSDLMRFFDLWGCPYENGKDGDIENFDYLFLGDFIGRGSHSLETICLLLALKVRYPNQIHLIRGNLEDKWINNGFGFDIQCNLSLGKDSNDEDSVSLRLNRLFEWLPLATVIEDKVICLHGGIGSSLHYISQIENLQRPLEVIHEPNTQEQQLVLDFLWSDPTESDQELGILPNLFRDPNGTGNIVKFGPDVVNQFLVQNNLSMIIRAHECVMDGFERFADGNLITVFSATDYRGIIKNAGAMLILQNNFEIIPKLIYPSFSAQQQHNQIEDDNVLQSRSPPPRWISNNIGKSFD